MSKIITIALVLALVLSGCQKLVTVQTTDLTRKVATKDCLSPDQEGELVKVDACGPVFKGPMMPNELVSGETDADFIFTYNTVLGEDYEKWAYLLGVVDDIWYDSGDGDGYYVDETCWSQDGKSFWAASYNEDGGIGYVASVTHEFRETEDTGEKPEEYIVLQGQLFALEFEEGVPATQMWRPDYTPYLMADGILEQQDPNLVFVTSKECYEQKAAEGE